MRTVLSTCTGVMVYILIQHGCVHVEVNYNFVNSGRVSDLNVVSPV